MRTPNQRLKAAGSHWALSNAAISDNTFIETHDVHNVAQAMGKTLFEVVPGCLNNQFLLAMANIQQPAFGPAAENAGFYLAHVQTGKRVYQLYSELDQGDDGNPASLAVLMRDTFNNSTYLGSWAFATLGGAGGQTVYGALTTGTHGGDFTMPPMADRVMALHLVADGGRHYWIEPKATFLDAPLTDDAKLTAFYGQDTFKGAKNTGPENFEIIRDNDMFDAVLIGAGRFGIVYSIVVRVTRQYSLHEERRLTTWQDIMTQVSDPTSVLFRIDPAQQGLQSRFLQVAVSAIPHANFAKNLAAVTKRWNVARVDIPNTNVPSGRVERVGLMLESFNTRLQAPLFAMAGTSHAYTPDPDNDGGSAGASVFEMACANGNFVEGIVKSVIKEIEDFIGSNGLEISVGLGAVAAAGGGGIVALIPALLLILALLAAFLEWLASQSDPRLGQQMEKLKDDLLSQGEVGLLIWQAIAFEVFS
ncbi:MAG: hypothetical protein ACREBE_29630, partial [bacterium]